MTVFESTALLADLPTFMAKSATFMAESTTLFSELQTLLSETKDDTTGTLAPASILSVEFLKLLKHA